MRKLGIVLLFMAVVPMTLNAQRGSVIGVATDPNAKEASKLAKQASKLWDNGEYYEAEKKYYEAFRLSPNIFYMEELAKNKLDLGDLKGSNKVWEDAIKVLVTKEGAKDVLYRAYQQKIDLNTKKGDPEIALHDLINFYKEYGPLDKKLYKNSSLFNIYFYELSLIAFQINDEKSLSEIYNILHENDMMKLYEFRAEILLLLVQGKHDEAIAKALKVEDDGGGFLFSRVEARVLLSIAYAYAGDVTNSKKYIKEAKKNILVGERFFYAVTAKNALTEKDYKVAIEDYTSAIKPRQVMWTKQEQAAKFVNYTGRAQAYEGLGDFINAKKDYEAALVYHPEYEQALTGLARLEGRVISERRADKLPPEIIITEPSSLTRGLKISGNGTDMMIKGIAKDSFGLKSVTINGTNVFTKEQGDFWGNVSLKTGLNTVVIEATDMAGNKASKTIEIEQPAAPVAVKEEEIIAATEKEGKNYALFIASQNYDDASIPSLENPIGDAVKLKLILKKNYGFKDDNIISLYNPEKSNFKQQFQQLSEVLQPEDNLVIFYAGHGVWVEKEKKGYWLLTDAKRNDAETWVSNKDVLDMIAKLPTRHTLLITDACFSGGVFKTRSLGKDAPAAMVSMNEKISRVAITSGNDTEVPDESVFMKYLVKALSENKDKYLTAQKMFITQIIEAVMTETKTEPRYGTLELAGHVGGDFIFVKK